MNLTLQEIAATVLLSIVLSDLIYKIWEQREARRRKQ